jgi:phosphatidylinositol N-acetylglucosaminyltransferase subunit P
MYLLWSYLPSPFLHQLGINYYPDRWWALAIPSFLVMTIVYIYIALAAYNTGYLTLPMSSIENIVDEAADVAVLDQRGKIRGRGSRDRASSFDQDGYDGGGDDSGDGARGLDLDREIEGAWKGLWNEGTDAVMDVPLGGVCQVLYSVA